MERYNQQMLGDSVDYGKVGIAFLCMGLVGLLFALYFEMEQSSKTYQVEPAFQYQKNKPTTNQPPPSQLGPIVVNSPGEVYEVAVKANIKVNSWAYIETEVLDANEEYLYSFGDELWHETGYEDGSIWTEHHTKFDTKLTFPYTGYYYLNFISSGKYKNAAGKTLRVTIIKRNGSSVLHLWIGVFCIVLGLILIELKYKIVQTAIENSQ